MDNNERQETRLALHMLLKVFSKTQKTPEQQKYYNAAKHILQKHTSILDYLRDKGDDEC